MDYLAIFVFSVTCILIYSIDVVLLGIAFEGVTLRYSWNLSSPQKLVLLIFGFAFLDSYLWPVAYQLDLTFTIGNNTFAKLFNLAPNQPFIEFFGFSKFTFLIWLSQALLAKIVGEKVMKSMKGN